LQFSLQLLGTASYLSGKQASTVSLSSDEIHTETGERQFLQLGRN